MKKYELPEFDIEDQELTREEILAMLFCNELSVFDMVRGMGDVISLPLHTHPDFASWEQKKEKFSMDLSGNAIGVLAEIRKKKAAELEKIKEAESKKEAAKIPDKETERRKTKVPVLINIGNGGYISGILVQLGSHRADVLVATKELAIGQQVQFSIVKRGGSDRYKGIVYTCKEQPDRRQGSAGVIYIYTIELNLMTF